MKNLYKNLIILSIIPATLLTNFAEAKNNQSVTKKKSQIIITKPKVEIKYDFRKTKWGMTKSQVLAAEKVEPQEENDELLVYPDSLLGIDAKISYFFENNKLIKAAYLFDGTFVKQDEYIADYLKIKKVLLDKYGSPYSDNSNEIDIVEKERYKQLGELVNRGAQEFDARWQTSTTEIKLLLKGKDVFTKVKLELGYTSKRLKHLDEEKEVEKSLF